MVQLSATRCSCIAILWVSLMSFASITLCLASQRVFNVLVVVVVVVVVDFVIDSVRNWIHPRIIIEEDANTLQSNMRKQKRYIWLRTGVTTANTSEKDLYCILNTAKTIAWAMYSRITIRRERAFRSTTHWGNIDEFASRIPLFIARISFDSLFRSATSEIQVMG
jgi:hypothetical protein